MVADRRAHRDRVIAFYRGLDEGPGPFRFFRFLDASLDGHRYWTKAVEVEGELVAIRQIEDTEVGRARRYWWQHLDDRSGMLTDQPLPPDPGQEGLIEISADEFDRRWMVAASE
jgi:hypothetical protein